MRGVRETMQQLNVMIAIMNFIPCVNDRAATKIAAIYGSNQIEVTAITSRMCKNVFE
jgi:hypothetical protein